MSGMFSHCHSLKTLDVDGFDLSSVRDMGYMFEYCVGLRDLDFSHFEESDADKVGMFEGVGGE